MKKRNNSIFKTLAELVYNKAIREDIEKRITAKYEKRIDYLVSFNNQLMKELEQYDDSLTPEESKWKRDML